MRVSLPKGNPPPGGDAAAAVNSRLPRFHHLAMAVLVGERACLRGRVSREELAARGLLRFRDLLRGAVGAVYHHLGCWVTETAE